jgi:DNA-binding SARP family transcriptional activator/Tfp pilus assembly protein PilF
LRVFDGSDSVTIRAAQQRVVLAILLCEANQVVTVDRLIDELWGEEPPARAVNTVQAYVLRLRRALDDRSGQTLVTRRPGYQLVVADGELDAQVFEQASAAGHRALAGGRLQQAADELTGALALWQGEALADVAPTATVAREATRLQALRLSAIEARIDALMELGQHEHLVAELEGVVAEHSLRERLHERLILALYRSGRRAEALEAYRQARSTLIDELGIDPGPELQALECAILNDDPALSWTPPRADGGRVTAVPAQLPAAPATFIGRREHLSELDDMVPSGPDDSARAPVVISAIAGTAGVGKTALAVWWAHRVRRRFPDGQLYIDLRGHAEGTPVRPIEALTRFLHALGLPAEQVPSEQEMAAELFRSLLADKRMLIVLDNAGDPDQVRPLLPGGAGCLVVITSRNSLSGLVAMQSARRLTLDVLTTDESLDLLRTMLGVGRVDREPAAAAELARLCAHLPLALRIAAANLGEHPQRRLADHVRDLQGDDRLAALEVEGDRQAAIGRAFARSYDCLPPAAARLFRLLGLAPGADTTPAAAAALAGIGTRPAGDLLDVLEAAHLITQRISGRYALHDLLRLYASRRALDEDSAQDRSSALQRMCRYHLHTADAAARLVYPGRLRLDVPVPSGTEVEHFEQRDQALEWIDSERDNLLATIEHAAAHGPHPVAWLLADTMRSYFWLRMRTVEWLAVATAGLEAAEAGDDVHAQSAAHLSLGDASRCQCRYEQAIAHYLRAAALARDAGWVAGQGAALGNLGNTYWRLGELHKSAQQHRTALALDRESGQRSGQAASLANLGTVYRELGRLDDAADHLTQALAISEELGSHVDVAMDLSNLGEVHFALGRLGTARQQLTQALARLRDVGDRDSEADTLRTIAAVLSATGHHDDALAAARDALTLARETGNRRTEGDTLNGLATIHQRLGRQRDALHLHRQALEVARTTRERHPETAALIGLAVTHLRLGDAGRARRHADEAVERARTAGYRLLEGDALLARADADLACGETERAATRARQARDLHRETGHRLGEARALVLLGDAEQATGRDPTASWRRALEIFAAAGAVEAGEVRRRYTGTSATA